MKALIWWCLSLTALLSTTPLWAQTSPFQFLDTPGSYAVGLKVVDQYDQSRTFPCALEGAEKSSNKNCARPLQTLIWYPSPGGADNPMTVGDYAQLAQTETPFDQPDKPNEWESKRTTSGGRATAGHPRCAVDERTFSRRHLCTRPIIRGLGQCGALRISRESRLCGVGKPFD